MREALLTAITTDGDRLRAAVDGLEVNRAVHWHFLEGLSRVFSPSAPLESLFEQRGLLPERLWLFV